MVKTVSRINVLEKHVAELIAAGEVIDRPCSVIKELTENAIDAGATAVTVEIKNGGITYMRVTDDGCGILKDDVRTAFIRHATSKISTEEDLNSIATFGFRGEALASIAVMSRVEMLTRTRDSQIGCRYEIHGGEEVYFDDAGCLQGTTIVVRDLFYNTPARMKFLKKDVAEGNAVAAVIDRIALSNPQVSVKFIRDSKVVLHTPGNGDLYSVLYSVFGREISSGFIPIEYEMDGIEIKGYITRPDFARSSRALQYFFINSRYVKTKTAMVAVEEAFKSSIVTGKFPGCVLNVKVPFGTVDVNVHPAKIEVRFVNERPIFDCIYTGVKSAISSITEKKEFTIRNATNDINPFTLIEKAKEIQQKWEANPPKKYTIHSPEHNDLQSSSVSVEEYRKYVGVQPTNGYDAVPQQATSKYEAVPAQTPIIKETPSSVIRETVPSVVTEDIAAETVEMRVVGEIFNTYIVAESGNNMLLIAKHAAHERLIYEKLKAENGEIDRQLLLSPVVINLSKENHAVICESVDVFAKAGFSLEDFGSFSVAIREIPVVVKENDIEAIVLEIADSIIKHKSSDSFEYLDRLYHSIACRSAIKANDRSFISELEALVERLVANPDIKYCPHGRPIYVSLSKRELEKQFGRIQ